MICTTDENGSVGDTQSLTNAVEYFSFDHITLLCAVQRTSCDLKILFTLVQRSLDYEYEE